MRASCTGFFCLAELVHSCGEAVELREDEFIRKTFMSLFCNLFDNFSLFFIFTSSYFFYTREK